ncbi:LysE/ArgO family amino acid transporter [Citricoccus alkalitolerans]|uniref:LysE/ArgO family amino acid transporter n=1 Tax=Citricoccus alkalitolerans TaxID=246603 RepID=A0ABV8XWZ8_9MICC
MTIFLTGLLTCLALIVAIGAQSLFIMRQAIRRDHLFLALAVCLLGDFLLIGAGTVGIGVITERAPWLLEVLKWGGVAYLLWFAYTSFRSAFGNRRRMAVEPDDGTRSGAEAPEERGEPALVGAGAGVGTFSAAGQEARDPQVTGPSTETMAVVSAPSKPSVTLHRDSRPWRALTPALAVVLTALSVSLLNPHAILDTVVMLGTIANSYGAEKWVFAGGALTGSALWFLVLGLGVRALAPLLDTPRTWKIVDIVVGSIMVFIAGSLALG